MYCQAPIQLLSTQLLLNGPKQEISPALDFFHLYQHTSWMSDKYFLLVPFQVWMEKIAAKGSQEGLSTSSK